jgi:hypothetical protein
VDRQHRSAFKRSSQQYRQLQQQDPVFFATNGRQNTATGVNALASNTTGNGNTAVGINGCAVIPRLPRLGLNALLRCRRRRQYLQSPQLMHLSPIPVYNNSALGYGVLSPNTTGGRNTATGAQALQSNIDGGYTQQ